MGMLIPAVKTLCWGAAPAETLETTKENVSSAPNCVTCYSAETPGCPTAVPNLVPCMLGDASSRSASLRSSAAPSLSSCLALVGATGEKQHQPAGTSMAAQPCGSSDQLPFSSPRSSEAAAPAPSVSRELPPSPEARLPNSSQEVHFYGMTPVGPQQEPAHDPGVRPRGSGTGTQRRAWTARPAPSAPPVSSLCPWKCSPNITKHPPSFPLRCTQTPCAGRPPQAVHPLPSSPLLFQAAARASSFRRSRGTGSRE